MPSRAIARTIIVTSRQTERSDVCRAPLVRLPQGLNRAFRPYRMFFSNKRSLYMTCAAIGLAFPPIVSLPM